jgi:hypothetical protein
MGIMKTKLNHRVTWVLTISIFILLFNCSIGSARIVNAAAFILQSPAQTETTVTLLWAQSADVYFYSYHVWFSFYVNGPFTEIYSTSTVGATSYGVGNLQSMTSYYFKIEDKGLFVDYYSNTIQVTTTSIPNLTKTGFDYSSVSLAWLDYNTQPYSALEPFVSYTLQISNVGSSGPWTTVSSITDPTQNNFRAMGLYATTYYFRLYDTVGPSGNTASSYSNVVSQSIPTPLNVTITATLLNMDIGQQDQFSASASNGISPYIYRWLMNGNPISGATSTTYLFNPASTGTYSFIAQAEDSQHIAWFDSNTISVQVNPPLYINISASAYSMNVTQQDQFSSVYGGGAPPYSFQWYSNGNPIAGATLSSYQFIPTTAGTYNIQGAITDSLNVTATSTSIQVVVHGPLTASISTSASSLNVGQLATLSTAASGGTPPYSYQWYLNDKPISGATTTTYVFNPSSAETYNIYVAIRDSANTTVNSNTITETVGGSSSPSSPFPFPWFPIVIGGVAGAIIVVGGAAWFLISRNRKKS